MTTSRFVLSLAVTAVLAVALLSRVGHQDIRASSAETVSLADGSVIGFATPPFIQKGKRYAFSWPGGGPPQTFTVKDVRKDGWILVEVAEEIVDPVYAPIGVLPSRWLNAALATSIQEMRPLVY